MHWYLQPCLQALWGLGESIKTRERKLEKGVKCVLVMWAHQVQAIFLLMVLVGKLLYRNLTKVQKAKLKVNDFSKLY